MKDSRILLFLVCIAGPLTGMAAAEEGHLSYSIPVDAKMVGPIKVPGISSRAHFLNYYPPDSDPSSEAHERIAHERYFDYQLIERTLFKSGKRHGLYEAWHKSGVKSESGYYNMGKLDGPFRHWDKKGRLVGSYEIGEDSSVKLIFHSNGHARVIEERHNRLPHGWLVEFREDGKVKEIAKWIRGRPLDSHVVAFHPDGTLYMINVMVGEQGQMSGIAVGLFTYEYKGPSPLDEALGNLEEGLEDEPHKDSFTFRYMIKGEVVGKVIYEEAAKMDPALPKILENPEDYKKMMRPELKAYLERAKKLKPVKIPLELDEKGRVLARDGGVFELP